MLGMDGEQACLCFEGLFRQTDMFRNGMAEFGHDGVNVGLRFCGQSLAAQLLDESLGMKGHLCRVSNVKVPAYTTFPLRALSKSPYYFG
jgi:hypothetical protein